MKKLKCGPLLLGFLFMLQPTKAQSKIVATINNARNDKGFCQVCLFDNAASFGGNGVPVKCVQAQVTGGNAEAVFAGIKAGVYAVAVFHDANKNGKMDLNFLGVPKEGYGASRNRLPFAAAPSFDENKFTVPNNAVTTVRMRLRNL